ncbi:MAG: hypothetical protein HW408_60 [Actinobacteria bacterium]|nr:hypothetical protein [Actinomycetota bacterium]
MSIGRAALAAAVAIAMTVSGCGIRKYVWWPSPPRNIVREAARPPAAETPKPQQDFTKAYSEAMARTREAVPRGAGKEALPLWKALEGSQWETDAIYNQGVLLHIEQDYDGAASHYRRIAGRSAVHEPAAANLLGIHLVRGEWNEAGALADRLLPAGTALPREMLPELASNIAAALVERGDYDRAAEMMLALRARKASVPSLSWNMAVLAYRQGNIDAARRLAAKIHPETANLFPVAASRIAWDRESAAVPAMDNASAAGRRMASLAGNLAAFEEYRKGNVAAAEAILARKPVDAETFPEIHTNAGMMQMERGKWKDARASLEKAVREKPGMPEGWINLGIFKELYEGNAPEALICYRRYITMNGSKKDEVGKWIEWLEKSPQ